MEIIYLDHAAATPLDDYALTVMKPYFSELFYNPSAPYINAVNVRNDYEKAKSELAQTFGAKGDELVITAGATESINLAFSCLEESDEVITINTEHKSVLVLAKEHHGKILSVNKSGMIDLKDLKNAITDNTKLISIAIANNEIGVIQPLREIAEIVKEIRVDRLARGIKKPIYLHADGSQGFTVLDINVSRLSLDLLTLNAGKIYGPKQVGLLWIKPGVYLKPIVYGGGQEMGLRSGTENVPGLIGFKEAAVLAKKRRSTANKEELLMREYIEKELPKLVDFCEVNIKHKKRLASHISLSFNGLDAERLLFRLEEKGVLVATGSACAANSDTKSHVLEAIGLNDLQIAGSLRLTLGRTNTLEQIKRAVEIIANEANAEMERLNAKSN